MKHLSKYIIFLLLLIIIFIILKEYKIIKTYELYKSGVCEIQKSSFGEYSDEYKRCILNLNCKSNSDCGNNDYACCFNQCKIKDNSGKCPKSDLGERCDLKNGDNDCLNNDNNLRAMCCKNPNSSLEWGRCVKSYVDLDGKKHCNIIDKYKGRIGDKCSFDKDCIDGGIKNNYGGTIRCCQGICENRTDGKCRPSEIGEKCKNNSDCNGYNTDDMIVCCNDKGGDIGSQQYGICTKPCIVNNVGKCPITVDPTKCQVGVGEICGSNISNEKDDKCIYGGTKTKCCNGICTEMDSSKKCPISKVSERCSTDNDCEPYKYGGKYKCCNNDGYDKNSNNFGKCTKPAIDATVVGDVIPISYCPNTAKQKKIPVKKDIGESCTLSTDCLGGYVGDSGDSNSNVCCGGKCKPKNDSGLFGAKCKNNSDCCSGDCGYAAQTCVLPGTFTIMKDGRRCCNYAFQNVPNTNDCVNKVCGV